jgi:RNA polymerase sigma factor (sigma-70 family)
MTEQCDCPPHDCAVLVRRYRDEGDKAALDELVRLYEARVRGLVGRVLNPAGLGDEVADCAQDAWVRVLGRLDRWRDKFEDGRIGRFCHWLSVVVTHVAVDYLKSAPPQSKSIDPNQIDKIANEIDFQSIIRCIEQLSAEFPPDIRAVFDLKKQRLSENEIAARLGIGVRTVRNRFRRARWMLKPCLEDLGWRRGR